MTFFRVLGKKEYSAKRYKKPRILTSKINFNFGLCKMDEISIKSEFYSSNFVGKTENLMPKKGSYSQYIIRVSKGERSSVSIC